MKIKKKKTEKKQTKTPKPIYRIACKMHDHRKNGLFFYGLNENALCLIADPTIATIRTLFACKFCVEFYLQFDEQRNKGTHTHAYTFSVDSPFHLV